MHLVLHYFSQYDGAIPLVEELRAAGVRVAAFQANTADSDAVRAYTRGSLKSSGTRTSFTAMPPWQGYARYQDENRRRQNLRDVGEHMPAAHSWSVARFCHCVGHAVGHADGVITGHS